MIELRINEPHANLGYGLARSYWGQGFATEATRAVVDWAIAQPTLYYVLGGLRCQEHGLGPRPGKGRHAARRGPAPLAGPLERRPRTTRLLLLFQS